MYGLFTLMSIFVVTYFSSVICLVANTIGIKETLTPGVFANAMYWTVFFIQTSGLVLGLTIGFLLLSMNVFVKSMFFVLITMFVQFFIVILIITISDLKELKRLKIYN